MNDAAASRHERQLVRGAIVNAAGTLAKLAHPLFFVVATRMFGTDIMGAYLVASFLLQIAVAGLTSGYHQGTIVFVSAHSDAGDERALYDSLGNAFSATLVVTFALLGISLFALDPALAYFYPNRPDLHACLRVLCLSLPFAALGSVAIGATKAAMHMEYDALLNGIARPLSLLAFAVIAWLSDGGAEGLAWAHTASEALVALASLWALSRHYSLARALRHALRPRVNVPLLRFAIPQSLDVMFNRYLTRLDVIMLAALGYTNHQVAFYSAAALVTDTLRQVRLTFSTALAPIVARDHAAGDREALAHNLSRVTRWTTSLVLPLAAVLLVARDDVLRAIDPAFVGDTRFMAVLLLPPVISCATGLAGNYLVFTRHSSWNLVNSLSIAGLNTLFNFLLIPRYGLMGAAAGTALAAAIVGLLQVVELSWLERVHMQLGQLTATLVGALGLAAGCAIFWDPIDATALGRVALALGLPSLFVALAWCMGHPEVRAGAERLTSMLRGLNRRSDA